MIALVGFSIYTDNVKEVQYLLKSLLSLVQKPNSPSATSLSSLCSLLLLFSVPLSYRSTCHKTIEFYIRKTFGIIEYHLIETKVLKHRDQRVCQKPHSYFIITNTTFQRQSCHDSMKAAEEQQEMLL